MTHVVRDEQSIQVNAFMAIYACEKSNVSSIPNAVMNGSLKNKIVSAACPRYADTKPISKL